MKYVYPFDIERDRQAGSHVVSFPDVPEAHTEGDTATEAAGNAPDCLIAALGGYIELNRKLPRPSRVRRGEHVVILPPLVAAKLALYQAMLDARMTKVSLAAMLGHGSETAARRLLDLDHGSRIEQVDAALAALGKRLIVEVRDAAA